MTASISARNRSRRVTLPFWLHAIPANVRCSPIPNLPTPSLDARSFYHVERLAQSFPSALVRDGESIGVERGRSARSSSRMPAVFVHGVPDTYRLWDKLRSHLARS